MADDPKRERPLLEMTAGELVEGFFRWLFADKDDDTKKGKQHGSEPIDTVGEPVAGDDAGKPSA